MRVYACVRCLVLLPHAAAAVVLPLTLFVAVGLPTRAAENAASPTAADRDWRVILALDVGPSGQPRDREQALTLARAHLARQEAALKRFTEAYPTDARRFEARVRLADILSAEARLPGPTMSGRVAAERRLAATRQLDLVETSSAAPAAVKTEAAYARVRQLMQDHVNGGLEEPGTGITTGGQASAEVRREALRRAIRGFDAAHPGDRRTPALLLELATLYDVRPAEKRALLDEVLARTSSAEGDAETRARAGDDLRRLALLNGRPVDLRLPPSVHGGGREKERGSNPTTASAISAADLATHRGRVVVLFFWASWSAPALRELAWLQTVAAKFDPRQVEFLSVSLDEDPAALAAAVRAARVDWPVHCDGHGWEGVAVRAVGLNALPTTWVLGRDGTLLTLNARGPTAAEDAIRQALLR